VKVRRLARTMVNVPAGLRTRRRIRGKVHMGRHLPTPMSQRPQG
jgi:hypothetical protein